MRDKGFIWNPLNYQCECNKACDFDEYWDYENCKLKISCTIVNWKLVAPLIDECTETVEEVKVAETALAKNENSSKCSSCIVYIVLMIVVFTVCTRISSYFVYYNWSLVKKEIERINGGERVEHGKDF